MSPKIDLHLADRLCNEKRHHWRASNPFGSWMEGSKGAGRRPSTRTLGAAMHVTACRPVFRWRARRVPYISRVAAAPGAVPDQRRPAPGVRQAGAQHARIRHPLQLRPQVGYPAAAPAGVARLRRRGRGGDGDGEVATGRPRRGGTTREGDGEDRQERKEEGLVQVERHRGERISKSAAVGFNVGGGRHACWQRWGIMDSSKGFANSQSM